MMRIIFLFVFLLSLVNTPTIAQAQTGEIWSSSVNISRSGASFSPSFVVDLGGVIHVFWLDEYAGLMYARSEGGTWSSPEIVDLPFNTSVPRIVLGNNNQIHAFWMDDEDNLYYSRGTTSNLGNSGAWSGTTFLSDSVLVYDTAVDNAGVIHLAYIRSVESTTNPPGVYYRKTNDGATSWQQPDIVYTSRYYRSLDSATVHVQITVSSSDEDSKVYLAWDNQPLKTVFFSRSLNGGTDWDPPAEIASPLTRASVTTPYNVRIATLGNQIVLVYQDGQPGLSCSQSFHYSNDQGSTWNGPQRMIEDVPGCALENTLFNLDDQYLVLMTANRDQVVLTAWDGNRWSESRQQSEMIQINDDATRSNLTLSCHKIQVDNNDELNLVGCDLERKDIWWKKRTLTDIGSWFQQDSAWRSMETIAIDSSAYQSVTITIDALDQIHAFWNQTSEGIITLPDPTMAYSRWESQNNWANPSIVQTSNQQTIEHIATEYDTSRGNLLLVWKDGLKGQINFSSSPANQAILPSSWSPPKQLSLPAHGADTPSIVLDSKGTIFVVYAVPINENRGIYLTISSDGGLTWSEPTQILDAASLGLEMINHPRLSISSADDFHLIWTDYQLTSSQPQPVGLYYSQSVDEGITWSEISRVSELPVLWSRLETHGSTIHRFWQEAKGNQVEIWHEVSVDNGQTWEPNRPFSLFGEEIGPPAIEIDSTGRIHLIQVLKTNDRLLSLQHLVWENRWVIQKAYELSLGEVNLVGVPAITISPRGFLGVVIPVEIANAIDNYLEYRLLFTGQYLNNLPLLETQIPPVATPIPAPAETTEAVQQVITPEPTVIAVEFAQTPPNAISPTLAIVIGVFFSTLIIASVVTYRLLRKQSS